MKEQKLGKNDSNKPNLISTVLQQVDFIHPQCLQSHSEYFTKNNQL